MSNNQKQCAVCNNAVKQLCKGCQNINYCSRMCQESDWQTHKTLCKTLKDFVERPSTDARRAILFPVNDSRPKFIWINKIAYDRPAHLYWETADVVPLLEGDEVKPQHRPITPQRIPLQRSNRLQGIFTHTIILAVRDAFSIDGSTQNQSIIKVTSELNTHDWRGPMIAYGMKGLGIDQTYTDDIDSTDFKLIVDYLLDYGTNKRIEKIQGVIVHCDADVEACREPRYASVEVPSSHPMFQHDAQRSQIAKRVGLSLLAQKMLQKPQWKTHGSNGNTPAVKLHAQINSDNETPGALSWGWAPRYWQTDPSNTLFVREDKKPLLVKDMESLCSWSTDILQPLVQDILEEAEGPLKEIHKVRLLDCITKVEFDEYKDGL